MTRIKYLISIFNLQNILYVLHHLFFLIPITFILNSFLLFIQNAFQIFFKYYYNIIEYIVDLHIYIFYEYIIFYLKTKVLYNL